MTEREGAVWEETATQFGNAIYWALEGGGAYSERMPEAEAEDRTRRYVEAFFGDTPEDRLHAFGLDPAFSSWFHGLYWDFAYVLVNRAENWLALVCATDVD